jgi:hypothetical protein
MSPTRKRIGIAVLAASAVLPAAGMLWGDDAAKTARSIAASASDLANANANKLSEEEKKAGWKLLFDGKTTDGWSNFRSDSIKPGWQVKDGALTCIDPKNAGDLVTKDQFDWFELSIEYNITPAGNSGIMFHVTEQGNTAWQTGPEIQIMDNEKGKDPNKSGWLYAIHKTEADATKPPGQWNHLRVLISPEKCEHVMNGTKYFEYVMGSDDFKERVAKSKFGKMPNFAKSGKGRIALQGDHGQVAYRSIKLRPIEAK